MSPQAIVGYSCGRMVKWTQTGTAQFADDKLQGKISFYDLDDALVLQIPLERHNGLYFSAVNTMTIDSAPQPSPSAPPAPAANKIRRPTTKRQ